MNILAISGSLRKDSYNMALLQAFRELAPEDVTIDIADIGSVPLYNQDDEAAFPQVVEDFKARIRAADALIIATPEYNRSMPGVLKNFIDWTSRPYGNGAWTGKPVFVVGASIAPSGTALAQYDLKKSLLFMDAHVVGQPEFYLGTAQDKFDAEGNLTDESTRDHIRSGLERLIAFTNTVTG